MDMSACPRPHMYSRMTTVRVCRDTAVHSSQRTWCDKPYSPPQNKRTGKTIAPMR
jgi:hypothetical protein